MDDFDFEESDEEGLDRDREEIIELRDTLNSLGYIATDLDYEQLLALQERENVIVDDTYMHNFVSEFELFYNSLRKSLAESKATLTSKTLIHGYVSQVPFDTSMSPFNENDTGVIVQVLTKILDSVSPEHYREEVTPNAVIGELLNIEDNFFARLDVSKLYSFLPSLIESAISRIERFCVGVKSNEVRREKSTDFLLRNEKCQKDLLTENLKVIKRIHKNSSGQYQCYCEKCDQFFDIKHHFVSYLVYVTEQSGGNYGTFSGKSKYAARVFPQVELCPNCGQGYVLYLGEYIEYNTKLHEMFDESIGDISTYLYNMSTGTAFTRVEPPVSLIEEVAPYLISTDVCSVSDCVVQDTESPIHTFIPNTIEYSNAVRNFYSMLFGMQETAKEENVQNFSLLDSSDELFDEISLSGSVSKGNYKSIAAYLTTTLSRNYIELHNRALCSIIAKIEESTIVADSLDVTTLWDKQNELHVLSCIKNEDSITKEQKDALNNVISRMSLLGLEFNIDGINIYKEQLSKDIQEMEFVRESLLKHFYNTEEALARIPIGNHRQVPILKLFSFCKDSSEYMFWDRVADRMIIQELSEDFYEMLVKGGVFNSKTSIKLCSDDSELYELMDKFLTKLSVMEFLPVDYAEIIKSRAAHVSLKCVCDLSDLAYHFKNENYYQFIKSARKLENIETLISKRLNNSISNVKKIADKADIPISMSQEVYYLRDFSEDEINSASAEERKLLQNIRFGRFVPKRIGNESLTDYLQRFIATVRDESFIVDQCYDYADKFMEFKDYFIDILLCDVISLCHCDNYSLSVMTRDIIEGLIEYTDEETLVTALELNEIIFNQCSLCINDVNSDSKLADNFEEYYKVVNANYTSVAKGYFNPYKERLASLHIPVNRKFDVISNELDAGVLITKLLTADAATILKLEGKDNEVSDNTDITDPRGLVEEATNEIECILGRLV